MTSESVAVSVMRSDGRGKEDGLFATSGSADEFEKVLSSLLGGIGSAVKARRLALGLSQSDLAEKAAVDRGYLSAIENGKQNLSLAALLKIALAIEMPIAQLVDSNG